MPELTTDDLLSNLYYDSDKGEGSAQSFYKQAAQQRKLLCSQTQARSGKDLMTLADAQLKYKECQCYIKLGEDR